MRFALRAAAAVAAVALPTGIAAPAHATGLACSTVTVSGTATGNHVFGPWCVPSSAPHCEDFGTGVDPDANVYADVCVPL